MGVFTREPRRATSLPYDHPRPITAAAHKLNVANKQELELFQRRRTTNKWQEDAWEYYDAIGEIKYAFRLFSNVTSRIRLYAGVIQDESAPPVKISASDADDAVKSAVSKAMKRVFSGASTSEILRKAAVNIQVAGECYLVQLPAKFGVRDQERWRIVSVDELVTKNNRLYVKTRRDQRDMELEEIPASTFVGRIWNEHARYSDEADSNMKALVDLCDELFLFSRAGRATARSRLNAGALFVPDQLSVAADAPTDVDAADGVTDPLPLDEDGDEFEQELIDSMTTPISDENSAASVVPLLIRGPADLADKIKLIKFERSFDPQLSQRADRALERILQGIDLPKDIVTGLANIKYSNAVQIEESLYTSHIEPLVLMLCDAFRQVYLVPALKHAGIDDEIIDKIVIWYDPSAIMTAPDKSSAANAGYDKYALSGEAWRRANGFSEADAPDEMEIAQRLAISRGQLSDVVTEALLKTLIPNVLAEARAQSIAESPSPLPPAAQEMLDGPQPPADPAAQPPPPAAPPTETAPVDDPTNQQPPPIVPGT